MDKQNRRWPGTFQSRGICGRGVLGTSEVEPLGHCQLKLELSTRIQGRTGASWDGLVQKTGQDQGQMWWNSGVPCRWMALARACGRKGEDAMASLAPYL